MLWAKICPRTDFRPSGQIFSSALETRIHTQKMVAGHPTFFSGASVGRVKMITEQSFDIFSRWALKKIVKIDIPQNLS